MFFMPWRLLLRHDGPFCGHWSMFTRLLCCYFSDDMFLLFDGYLLCHRFLIELFKLCCIDLSSVDWVYLLHILPCRILLCDKWSVSCNWLLHFGNVCNICVKHMLVLFRGHVFECSFVLKLQRVCLWNLSGIDRVFFLHGLSLGFVLRHHGSLGCDGLMPFGLLFNVECLILFNLSRWYLLDEFSFGLHELRCWLLSVI